MLSLTLQCRALPGCYESEARQVVFSNVRIWENIDGSIFSLTPSGSVGAAWAYLLTVRVFSPPPQPGTLITPGNELLDDVRTLLSYFLDIELHPDVDGCRALSGGRLARDLDRLIPRRFEPSRELLGADTKIPLEVFERLISTPDAHLLVVQRAAKAYERGMLALARGQRDLAYVLLIFVLECLAQTRSAPERIPWEQYPPGQRKSLDRVMTQGAVPEETALRIRETLTSARHLRVTENFREFVLDSLTNEFFVAGPPAPDPRRERRRLRRSLMTRLLAQAYGMRSGFAHALAPITEAVSAHAEDEFCSMRDGELALTFRGLHRVVRGVMSNVLANRCTPTEPVAPPDMPGVIYAQWSYEHWLYQALPRTSGSDARYWIATLLRLHVAFCVRSTGARPPQPIPLATIGAHAASSTPEKSYRPAMLALASICGYPPAQEARLTIETLIARVFLGGTCGENVREAAKVLEKHFATGTPGLDLPPLIEIALAVAVARGFHALGERAECRLWLEIARDDAVDDGGLQNRLASAVEEGGPIDSNTLLFPRSTFGRLLEGFATSSTT